MSRIRWIAIILFLTAFALSAEASDLILPITLNGYTVAPMHYQTIIRIVNISSSKVQITLEAFTNEGKAIRILELFPIARPGTTTVFEIPPFGSVEAFTAEDVPTLNGWIRLTSDGSIHASAEVALINAAVGPHPICVRPSTEILTSTQVPAVSPSQKVSAFAVVRPYRKSAFAIVNPSPTQTATSFLSLMDLSGNMVASATIQLAPQSRVSKFIQELMPDAPTDFMGSLRFSSSIPVGVGGVNVLFPEGEFSNISIAASSATTCVTIIAPARNPLTGECRVFPSPCDVPDGWVPSSACN